MRFIQSNSKGFPILTVNSLNTNYPNSIFNNLPIVLPDKSLDRLKKYRHLYIGKTVNKDNIVEIGNILQYRIIIRNMGKKIIMIILFSLNIFLI